jgi:F-type H+-transporting ATPase subunit delta
MRQTKVAQRYAKALFDLSVETGKVEEVKKDLDLIKGIEHKELELLLKSPVVAGEKKVAVFEAVFSKHVQPLTVSFFKLIFEKGRSVAIQEIIEAFMGMYRDRKGIKVASLPSNWKTVPSSKASRSSSRKKSIRLSSEAWSCKWMISFLMPASNMIFNTSSVSSSRTCT